MRKLFGSWIGQGRNLFVPIRTMSTLPFQTMKSKSSWTPLLPVSLQQLTSDPLQYLQTARLYRVRSAMWWIAQWSQAFSATPIFLRSQGNRLSQRFRTLGAKTLLSPWTGLKFSLRSAFQVLTGTPTWGIRGASPPWTKKQPAVWSIETGQTGPLQQKTRPCLSETQCKVW